MQESNPYAAPTVRDWGDPPAPHPERGDCRGFYPAVFALNLFPIPMMFAWDFAREGRGGLMLAVTVLFAAGFVACLFAAREVGIALVRGGIVVGLSQFFPILHFFAGSGVLDLVNESGLTQSSEEGIFPIATGNRGAFVVILATGALLMMASFAVGALIRALRPFR